MPPIGFTCCAAHGGRGARVTRRRRALVIIIRDGAITRHPGCAPCTPAATRVPIHRHEANVPSGRRASSPSYGVGSERAWPDSRPTSHCRLRSSQRVGNGRGVTPRFHGGWPVLYQYYGRRFGWRAAAAWRRGAPPAHDAASRVGRLIHFLHALEARSGRRLRRVLHGLAVLLLAPLGVRHLPEDAWCRQWQ